MLDEHAELLVVAHQGAADAASVLDAGAAQLAACVGEVADALRVAFYVALFGGLSDAEHDLPPLEATSRNGRPSVLYRLASLIFDQYQGLQISAALIAVHRGCNAVGRVEPSALRVVSACTVSKVSYLHYPIIFHILLISSGSSHDLRYV